MLRRPNQMTTNQESGRDQSDRQSSGRDPNHEFQPPVISLPQGGGAVKGVR